MRQVMPHRNNIVAPCRSCKTFLRMMGLCPLKSGYCCNSAPERRGPILVNKVKYNKTLYRFKSADLETSSHMSR